MNFYGLIGRGISHSLSKELFNREFEACRSNCSYKLFNIENLDIEFASIILKERPLGLNITAPYKADILKFVDIVSPEVREIGAANTLKIEYKRVELDSSLLDSSIFKDKCNIHRDIKSNDCKYGSNSKSKIAEITAFNTDWIGFDKVLEYLINRIYACNKSVKESEVIDKNREKMIKSAVIIGNGQSSKSVAYTLRKRMIPFVKVVREVRDKNMEISFESYAKENGENLDNILLINTTPVGMFPSVNSSLDCACFNITPQTIAIDLIYNPPLTTFLKYAKNRGATIINGKMMLEEQAKESWKIWKLK